MNTRATSGAEGRVARPRCLSFCCWGGVRHTKAAPWRQTHQSCATPVSFQYGGRRRRHLTDRFSANKRCRHVFWELTIEQRIFGVYAPSLFEPLGLGPGVGLICAGVAREARHFLGAVWGCRRRRGVTFLPCSWLGFVVTGHRPPARGPSVG